MKQRLLITVTLLTAAILATAVPAFAQVTAGQPPRPPRPNRGLFGGTASAGNTTQRLVLSVSFGGGLHDDLVTESTGGSVDPLAPALRSGTFSSGSASLNYNFDRDHVSAVLSASGHGRYFPGQSNAVVGSYAVAGRVAIEMGSRSTLSLALRDGLYLRNLALYYDDPSGSAGTMNTLVDPGAFTDAGTYQSLHGSVQFGHRFSNRLTLNADYGYYLNDAWSTVGYGRYAAQAASAGVGFTLVKGLDLRLGYSYTDSGFGGSALFQPYTGRTIDAGISFDRPISLTRRTTLSFATGLVGVRDLSSTMRYYVTGHANVAHEIGRSWTLGAGYIRSADFYQALGQPALLDTLNVGLGGLVGRRLSLNAGGGFARGTIGIAAGAPGYAAATAGLGLQIAITRQLAFGMSYTFYHHEFDNSAILRPGLLSRMEWQSVRVSLDFWAPLLTHARRTNASR